MFIFSACSSAKKNNPIPKPKAAILPIYITDGRSLNQFQSLQKSLKEGLSKTFHLESQQRVETALEQAFEKLQYKQCNKKKCIIFVQDYLEVGYLFQLEIIPMGVIIKLNLNRFYYGAKNTFSENCERCSKQELANRIKLMANKIFYGEKSSEKVLKTKKAQGLYKQEEKDQGSLHSFLETQNIRIRGLYGSYSHGNTRLINSSLAVSWDGFGIGVSNYGHNMTSNAGNKYELTAKSYDFFFTGGDIINATAGVGWVYSGEGNITSSMTSYQTSNISGTKYFGLLGYEWESIEALMGYQYLQLKYFNFDGTRGSSSFSESLSISGGLFLFGLGMMF